MRVVRVCVRNYKGIDGELQLELSPKFTILVGPNNSGKSAILSSLALLQGRHIGPDDVHRDSKTADIRFAIEGYDQESKRITEPFAAEPTFDVNVVGDIPTSVFRGAQIGNARFAVKADTASRFIFLYEAHRQTSGFDPGTGANVDTHDGTLKFAISRATEANRTGRYFQAIERITGLSLGIFPNPTGSGMEVGLDTGSQVVPLQNLGSGIAQIVAMVADVMVARNALFLIDEPEMNLHPFALRALLELFAEHQHQYVLSTHSHVVVQHLGSRQDTRIYEFQTNRAAREELPKVSACEIIDRVDRLALLERLGYQLSDFDRWDAWLFLEESSAERLIRDFFVPWFTPRLEWRLRTVAAGGATTLDPKISDFQNYLLYAKLEDRYVNRVWVRADGDEAGLKAIKSLEKFKQYFDLGHWNLTDFELYYPQEFPGSATVESILATQGKKEKREAKKKLLDDLLLWISKDCEVARAAFERSAQEVIVVLKQIESALQTGQGTT